MFMGFLSSHKIVRTIVATLVGALLMSCSGGGEDRLSFGIGKKKADMILAKSAKLFKADSSACSSLSSGSKDRLNIDLKNGVYKLDSRLSAPARRLMIYHTSPGEELRWKWESNNKETQFGKFALERSPSCFFVDRLVAQNFSSDAKFTFFGGGRLRILNIRALSSLRDTTKGCDFKTKLAAIKKRFTQSQADFLDEKSFSLFIRSFLVALKEDSCKLPQGIKTVPIYSLCGAMPDAPCTREEPDKWFRYIRSQQNRFPLAQKFMLADIVVRARAQSGH